jgi:hypothetical protein
MTQASLGVIFRSPSDNPINRLSFRESFNIERFAQVSHDCALSHVNEFFRSRAGDGVMVVVNGLLLLPSNVEMTVTVSQAGQTLLEEGKAIIARQGDTRLPLLKDVKTGRIIEQMKEAPMVKAFSNLAALSALAIGAAHLIAGADIAKRLTRIESKVDLLIAYRRIDQLSTLERIFTSAKELLNGNNNPDRQWELWRLRGELRELRLAWRREFDHRLSSIEDPEEAIWFQRMFTSRESSDRTIYDSVREGQAQLALVEYSLRLDHVLAVISGTHNEFERTLADELVELETTTELLKNKANLISGSFPELTVEPMAMAMTEIVDQYRSLLPETHSVSKTIKGAQYE